MIPQTQKSSRKFFRSKLQKLFFFFLGHHKFSTFCPIIFVTFFQASGCKLEEFGTVVSSWRLFRGVKGDPVLGGRAEGLASTRAPFLISVQELLMILHGQGEMLDQNLFSPSDTPTSLSSCIFLWLCCAAVFPHLCISVLLSAQSLCRSSLLSQVEFLGVSCPPWVFLCPLHCRSCLFRDHQQLWFPVLHHQVLWGDQLRRSEEENDGAGWFWGLLVSLQPCHLPHTWLLCSSSYGTHDLL